LADTRKFKVVLKDPVPRATEYGEPRPGQPIWLTGSNAMTPMLFKIAEVLPAVDDADGTLVVEFWTGEPPKLSG
jgi:hypothetical protein